MGAICPCGSSPDQGVGVQGLSKVQQPPTPVSSAAPVSQPTSPPEAATESAHAGAPGSAVTAGGGTTEVSSGAGVSAGAGELQDDQYILYIGIGRIPLESKDKRDMEDKKRECLAECNLSQSDKGDLFSNVFRQLLRAATMKLQPGQVTHLVWEKAYVTLHLNQAKDKLVAVIFKESDNFPETLMSLLVKDIMETVQDKTSQSDTETALIMFISGSLPKFNSPIHWEELLTRVDDS